MRVISLLRCGQEGRIENCPNVLEVWMEQRLGPSNTLSGFSSVYCVSQRRPESERLLNSMKFSEQEVAALRCRAHPVGQPMGRVEKTLEQL